MSNGLRANNNKIKSIISKEKGRLGKKFRKYGKYSCAIAEKM